MADSFSLAGTSPTYADRMKAAFEQAQGAINPMLQGLPENQKYMAPLMTFGLGRDILASDPQIMMETLEKMEPFYQRRAEKQQQMAMQSNLFASFLKDVPAAISNAFAQRQRYGPEAVEIAARSMQRQGPQYGGRNYYGFVG
jgi:hypothetical protein